MLRGLVAALVSAALLLGGCGGGASEQTQVRTVLARFGAAVARRDYRQLCTQLLAGNLTEKLERIGLPCEQAMRRGLGGARHPMLRVRAVRVTGATASALVYTTASNQPASEDTIGLVKVHGSWRITSLGSGA